MKALMNYWRRRKNVILFTTTPNRRCGGASGSLAAFNMFKPALCAGSSSA